MSAQTNMFDGMPDWARDDAAPAAPAAAPFRHFTAEAVAAGALPLHNGPDGPVYAAPEPEAAAPVEALPSWMADTGIAARRRDRDRDRDEIVVVALGDLHIDDRIALAGMLPTHRETGEPLVLAQARRTYIDWVTSVVRAAGADVVLVGGDVYERPRPSPAAEAVAVEALAGWADLARTFVLLGNHDRPHGDGVHALEPLKQLRPGRLAVLDQPGHVDIPVRGQTLRLYPLPYPSRCWLSQQTDSPEQTNALVGKALSDLALTYALDARQHDGPTALLAHVTLRGAAYSEYQTVPMHDVQVSTDGWDAFDAAICSHLHLRQRAVGCEWSGEGQAFTHGYIGAPDRHDFGEAGQPVGITIYRWRPGADGPEVEFVPNPLARLFVTLAPEDFDAQEDFLRADAEAGYQRRIYRVKGTVTEATADALNARIRSLKAAGVVIRSDLEVERATRARVEGVRLDGGTQAVLDAVFEGDESLREHEDHIRRFAAEREEAERCA